MIKKYHVSANKFNVSSVTLPPFADVSGNDASYTFGSITDGIFTCKYGYYGSNCYINYPLSLQAGTYTISFDARGEVGTTRVRIMENGNTTAIYSSTISDITTTYSRFSKTFTLENDTIIRIQIQAAGSAGNYTNLDLQYKNIMLNEGSTALPYEPYGDSFKDWFYREYGTDTDTITSLPKTIIGDGQPISSYTIKGNMSQSGTPTPSNPVYPTEVGDKTANLLNASIQNLAGTSMTKLIDFGEDVTFNELTLVSLFDNAQSEVVYGAYFDLQKNDGTHQYIGLSGMYNSVTDERFVANTSISGDYYHTYTEPITFQSLWIYRYSNAYNKFSSGTAQIAMYADTTSKYFEPYGLYKIPILSNGVSYPIYLSEPIRKIGDYADTINSDGTVTRVIKKLMLDGSEDWRNSSSGYYGFYFYMDAAHSYPSPKIKNSPLLCNMAQYTTDSTNYQTQPWYCMSDSTFAISTTITTGYANWKAYLADLKDANTPMEIWYVLETPTTETVTAPTLPTTGTAESFDVSTTLKPSEVSLTYHGWHEHEDTKFTT